MERLRRQIRPPASALVSMVDEVIIVTTGGRLARTDSVTSCGGVIRRVEVERASTVLEM